MILVSDGQPTGEWEPPLETLLASPRAAKAVRLALGIGTDARLDVLQRFVSNPEIPVFRADEARRIDEFFQWVTMTVVSSSRSLNPNAAPIPTFVDLSSLDF